MKRFYLLCVGMIVCLMLSGCALLPKEEVFAKAPVSDDAQEQPYTFTMVERGDLAKTQSLYCVYGAVRKESLGFTMDGSVIESVFVATGDSVTQGQLLACVDLDATYDRLTQIDQQIGLAQLQLSYVDRYEALARERAMIEYQDDSAARSVRLDEVSAQYERQRAGLNDQLSCLKLEKEEKQAQVRNGELRAPFDGTVIYARASVENTLTNKDFTMFTIADSARSVFSAETEYWDYFKVGDPVSVVMISGEPTYEATVVDETELGKEASQKLAGQKAMVYFELNDPVYNLEYDDHANVTLAIESRENVLVVNTRALVSMGDEQVVYYIDPADGLKKYKPVKLGLIASNRAEVLEGLTEGELVILK